MARGSETPIPRPEATGPETPVISEAGQTPVDDQGFVAQPVEKSPGKGPYLRGASDIGTHREITRRDFESLGIDQDTLVFDWKKDYKLPLEGINPEAVKYLTENEYGFSVVDE